MKLKKNENWPSVILHDGKPYLLKKLTRKGVNDPCSMCDLRQLCMKGPRMIMMLYDLCTSDGRSDAYYYEEDWSIYDKMIADFLEERIQ